MTPTKELTERQREILEFIRAFIDKNEYAPSVRELMAAFEIKSPNGMCCHLTALAKKGCIIWNHGQSRTIRYQRVKWGPGQPRSRTKTWKDPLRWNREAEKNGVRKKVFCALLADWLDDEVPAQWREDLFDLIEACKNIDWLMLTKRPENAATMLTQKWLDAPLQHVWFGVTAENQKYWDIRVPQLAMVPAALRWVSYEPSLGPLSIDATNAACVDWLIIGGESAQAEPARPFALEWAQSSINQCRTHGIVPFMKQIGSNATLHGKPFVAKDKAGADPDEWPIGIRVREFPASMVPS